MKEKETVVGNGLEAAVLTQAIQDALAPIIEQLGEQKAIETYLTSPEIEERIIAKQAQMKAFGKQKAQPLFDAMEELGPWMIISYAWAIYFKARNKYFEARTRSDESIQTLARQQEKGVKTGAEAAATHQLEEPMNEMSKSEWWLEKHNSDMEKHTQMAYAAQEMVELANKEIELDGKAANSFIEVDLSEKSYIKYQDDKDARNMTQAKKNSVIDIRAYQIDRDTRPLPSE